MTNNYSQAGREALERLGGWGRVGHSQRAPSEEASDRGLGLSDVEPSHPRLTEGMRTEDQRLMTHNQ